MAKSIQQAIKAHICIATTSANYPLGDFVDWAASFNKYELLNYLDHIQQELDDEAEHLRYSPYENDATATTLRGYWCMYCAQIRAYYRAILNNPACKLDLDFLLIRSEKNCDRA